MTDKIISVIKYIVLLIVTVTLGAWAIFYLIDLSEKSNTADLPKDETPPVINELPTAKEEARAEYADKLVEMLEGKKVSLDDEFDAEEIALLDKIFGNHRERRHGYNKALSEAQDLIRNYFK